MFHRTRNRILVFCLCAGLAAGLAGCTPTDETVNSLVDLTASTTGNFVEIIVKAAIEGLLTLGNAMVDLTAPLSQQSH